MTDPAKVDVEILPHAAIDEMVAKVVHAAAQPAMSGAVAAWLAEHHLGGYERYGHSFAVVGGSLMLLHPCPDGVVLPFEVRPDGVVKAYADPDHAGESFD